MVISKFLKLLRESLSDQVVKYTWSDSNLSEFLNRAVIEVIENSLFFRKRSNFPITLGDSLYENSELIYKIRSCWYQQQKLKIVTRDEIEKLKGVNWESTQGENITHLVLEGDFQGKYRLYPIPSTSYSLVKRDKSYGIVTGITIEDISIAKRIYDAGEVDTNSWTNKEYVIIEYDEMKKFELSPEDETTDIPYPLVDYFFLKIKQYIYLTKQNEEEIRLASFYGQQAEETLKRVTSVAKDSFSDSKSETSYGSFFNRI